MKKEIKTLIHELIEIQKCEILEYTKECRYSKIELKNQLLFLESLKDNKIDNVKQMKKDLKMFLLTLLDNEVKFKLNDNLQNYIDIYLDDEWNSELKEQSNNYNFVNNFRFTLIKDIDIDNLALLISHLIGQNFEDFNYNYQKQKFINFIIDNLENKNISDYDFYFELLKKYELSFNYLSFSDSYGYFEFSTNDIEFNKVTQKEFIMDSNDNSEVQCNLINTYLNKYILILHF